MRKSIFIGIVGVGVAVSFLVAVMSGLMFQRVILDIIKDDILQYSVLMHQELEERLVENEWQLGSMIDNGIRLTIVEEDGTVFYDSHLDASTMDNHGGREEIQQAMDLGYGESTRYSDSLHEATYYYARRLSNHMIMRLSKSTDSWILVFSRYIPIGSIALILIVLFAFTISSKISLAITKPLETLAQRFQHGNVDVPYRELLPFQNMILKQREQINQQMMELRRERDKLTGLMDNMNEGFMILDMQRRIISINEAAISLLKARAGSYFYKNILSLTRNPGFFEALDLVYEGEHQTKIIEVDGKSIRFFMNTIEDHEVLTGVMIFLLDVSKQIKLEKMRREFTSNVSHELKTPLTSISGFAEMIHNDMIASIDDAKYFAGKIQQEAARLITMVNEILRLSQIEEAREKEFALIDLNQSVKNVIEQLQLIAKNKNVSMLYDPKPISLEANGNMITELIYNLIDNAIRYNHPDKNIVISIEQDVDNVLLRVVDEGIGIPKKYTERIFERFFTVDKSHSKKQGGTGLGLSIVKHIVEYHNGRIAVNSDEGVGTEFVVSLPISQSNQAS